MNREHIEPERGPESDLVRSERREGERSEPERLGGGTKPATLSRNGNLPTPEVPEKARRRRFSPEYKKRILEEVDACSQPGEVGALLRREGLYSSQLSEWRRLRKEGALRALGKKRGRKPVKDGRQKELEQLQKENRQLRRKLEKAEFILEVQKKASEILGIPLNPNDNEESDS